MSRLPDHRPTALRSARGVLPLVVAMLLFAALLGAGTRHFYCRGMDVVLDAPCCAHPGHSPGDDAASVRPTDPDCCAAFVAPRLPSSVTTHAAPAASPAAFVGLLPATPAAHEPALAKGSALLSWACGPPPTPGEARARLMVFVI